MNETASVFQMISGAGFVVKMVLLVLLSFSITSWTIIIIKFRLISKAHKESSYFVDSFWQSRNLADAFVKAKKLQYSTVASLFRTGYMELKRISNAASGEEGSLEPASLASRSGMDNIRRTLRRAASSEINRMTQLVPFLATAGSTAPFIGLFGTVWGIMNSFQGIAQKGSANLAVVAPGIAEALIATAVGLAVAIPSVIAYNYFSQKIKMIDYELRNFSSDFLTIIERDILRQKVTR
jgi:biopolymer transport protein TolQ